MSDILTQNRKFEEILLSVRKPARYTGGELNSIVKRPQDIELKIALAYPDIYEVGMSYTGLALLYHILNRDRLVACERVFSPWPDFEEKMRRHAIPLYTLETKTPLKQCDVLGFTLQYEMSYATLLNMLELAGIPLFSAERRPDDPIVIAGGPCALNPEPLADFIDAFFIGDAEENLPLFCRRLIEMKREGLPQRSALLKEIAESVPGVYVPSLYEERHAGGRFLGVSPRAGGKVPEKIKAQVFDISKEEGDAGAPYPTAPIIPYIETVHDRISIEIMRGCPNKCRFCFSKFTKHPVRYRRIETILKLARETYANTGHREISLLSLSTNSYPGLKKLIEQLNDYFKNKRVSISLPSLRVEKELAAIPALVSQVRKTGLTFALEAATERLRKVIDKRITDEAFFNGLEAAYGRGWNRVKLYFMAGLPTETSDDLKEMAAIIKKASWMRKKIKGSPANVNATISPFIPKPFTPFQWEPMRRPDYFRQVRSKLFSSIPKGRIRLKFHNIERSFLEAVFCRGDRKLSKVLRQAHRRGCRLDGWSEHFDFDRWRDSFEACGIDPDEYACRKRPLDEVFPWGHIDVGYDIERLKSEYEKACEVSE